MWTRVNQFAAVILTAVALIPGGAHLFALDAKMAMPEQPYFIAQQVYRGWAWLGAAIFLAIFANFISAILTRENRRAFALSVLAGTLISTTLVIFLIWTQPTNEATANWTSIPDNWRSLRATWEYSHAVNATLTFLALLCAVGAMQSWRHPLMTAHGSEQPRPRSQSEPPSHSMHRALAQLSKPAR